MVSRRPESVPSPLHKKLALLGRRGAIGSARPFALAGVLARVLRITAALSLTIIFALTGVLGRLRILGGDEQYAWCGRAIRGCSRLSGNWLGVEAGRCATEDSGERSCQSQRICSVGLHGGSFLGLSRQFA